MGDKYTVTLEVAGRAAMFARPDTGGTPTSYPVPTWSAAKAIFESIAFLVDGAAWICPTKVQICRPVGQPGGTVHYQRYTTNYGGPLRKSDLFNKGTARGGSSMQVFASILSEVCYRLHGTVIGAPGGQIDRRHHLCDLFVRRIARGQCFRTPCLGWSEFTCSYWGPFREGQTEADQALSLEIPSMLFAVWSHPHDGEYEPRFCQNVKVDRGTLVYEVPGTWLSTGGISSVE